MLGSVADALAQDESEEDKALQVIVGPGGRALDPMAVPELVCKETPAAPCRTVTDVLRGDLTLSFFFKVLPPRSYLADPGRETLDGPDYAAWNAVGARYLIKGEITGPGPNLELRLFNVTGKAPIPVREQSFRNVSERQLRRVAHQFANGVLEAITGKPGVFDTRVAYSFSQGPGAKGIGLVDMDGANRTGYIGNGSINMLPSWGFGGVLYTSFKEGKPDIYFGKTKLSKDEGHYRKVAVSPDGSSMVASIAYGGQSDLYLLSKDGAVLKNLTNSPADEVAPTISPDGAKVAFVSSAAGNPQIYMIPIGGGAMLRLTHAGSYNYAPDWGPQGLIVFTGMDDGKSDVFSVTEGGAIERLTQNQGSNSYASWSADGRYLAFVSSRPEGSGIYLASADGRYQKLILPGYGFSNCAFEPK
jgi:TolB protein